jgi:NTE family protein
MYLGRYYTSFRLAHRLVIPQKEILFVDLSITENRVNYYSNDITSLFDAYFPSYIQRRETIFEAATGRPLNNYSTIRGRLLFGWQRHNYFQDMDLVETGAPDNTQYLNGSFKVQFESSRINRKQFPTEGNYTTLSASLNTGYEYFETGNADTLNIVENKGLGHSWYKLNFKNEQYFSLSRKLTLGTLAEITVSNKGNSSNYTATQINSYSFRPTDFSNLIYAESLRSNSFLGAGLRPIITISNNFSIRSGAYLFIPVYPVYDEEGNAVRGDIFSEYRGVAEIGAVYHSPVGPISIGANIFSHENRKVFYYLNFGYILFNKSGLD